MLLEAFQEREENMPRNQTEKSKQGHCFDGSEKMLQIRCSTYISKTHRQKAFCGAQHCARPLFQFVCALQRQTSTALTQLLVYIPDYSWQLWLKQFLEVIPHNMIDCN